MSRVEVSPALVSGSAGAATRCKVQVEPARDALPASVRLEPAATVTLLVDERARVTWAGGGAEALLGRAVRELVGRSVAELGVESLDGDVEAVLGGGAAVERRGVTRDGRQVAARVESGAPATVVVTLDDAAGRARASRHAQALDALERLTTAESVDEVARGLVDVVAPALADVALVRVVERDGAVSARKHRDPAQESALETLERLLPATPPESDVSADVVLRLERPLLLDLAAEDLAAATGLEQVGRLVADLDLRAAVVVPVALSGGVALLAAASTGARALDEQDVQLLETLGRRAALVLDRLWFQRRMRRAVHTRERLMSSFAHDLRNPAAAISMAADILISRLPPGDSGTSLKMIHRAANQINALVQKVADESAADAADAE